MGTRIVPYSQDHTREIAYDILNHGGESSSEFGLDCN
jgi:hypothetical protein